LDFFIFKNYFSNILKIKSDVEIFLYMWQILKKKNQIRVT